MPALVSRWFGRDGSFSSLRCSCARYTRALCTRGPRRPRARSLTGGDAAAAESGRVGCAAGMSSRAKASVSYTAPLRGAWPRHARRCSAIGWAARLRISVVPHQPHTHTNTNRGGVCSIVTCISAPPARGRCFVLAGPGRRRPQNPNSHCTNTSAPAATGGVRPPSPVARNHHEPHGRSHRQLGTFGTRHVRSVRLSFCAPVATIRVRGCSSARKREPGLREPSRGFGVSSTVGVLLKEVDA